MVEHFQEYDIIWRGENGRTYFLQNEKCYGLGSYDVFINTNDVSIFLDNEYEVPDAEGVKLKKHVL